MLDRTRCALAGLIMVACAGGDGAEWAGTVTDSAGIAIVTNPATGLWMDAVRPAITEEWRIGTQAGDPNLQFGAITGLDVGSDGSVYVLDTQARTVRVYDQAGTYLRTIGGPGSGPGELGPTLVSLMLGPGDTVLVPDIMQQRVNRYAPDGASIGQFGIPFDAGIPMRWEQTPDRQIVQQVRIMELGGPPSAAAAPVEPVDRLLLRAPDGTLTDTLMTFASGATFQFRGNSAQIRLFDTEPMWAIGLDGTVFFGLNSEFSIEMRTSDGVMQRIVRLPMERKPVTDADQQQFREMMSELFAQQGLPPETVAQISSMIQFAEFYPAYSQIMGGPENTMWVQRVRTATEAAASGESFDPQQGDSGSRVWDVFDAEGRYLGPLEMPARFQPLHVTGNTIYGVGRDDVDVQYVVKLRLDGLSGA
ncbi:MAG: hypothetical protein ACREL7_03515 [Longimicrobiales bacterium]